MEIGIKNQRFGMEDEMTGITRKQAAGVLGGLFGTEPYYLGSGYGKWCVKDREGKVWSFVSDASIEAQKKENGRYVRTSDNDYSTEMVSPILEFSEIEKLQDILRALKNAGAKVNSSCGMHVHIDAANHNRNSLKNLLGIMYAKEDMLFKALNVNKTRAARWCKKVREPILKKARKLSAEETRDMTRLEDIWYDGSYEGRSTHYNNTRYYALNLHSVFSKGTVEFRCFNATLHAGRARAYINLCLAISAQAISQRSTVMRKTKSENEKFTFRTWLIRLGLNGEEFKTTRDHLLANLEGDRAWRYDKDSYEVNKEKNRRKER